MKICFIAGARPNFMKVAALIEACKKYPEEIEYKLIHTGQHYDKSMSKVFFDELGLPRPDFNLGVGGKDAETQKKEIVEKLSPILRDLKPQVVVVVGDVTSTLAGALAAKKSGIPVAHVEAGLRSFNDKMPEEYNRRETDKISDFLFVSEPSGEINLKNEKIRGKIFCVGNVMIDTLKRFLPLANKPDIFKKLKLVKNNFVLITLHRAENVDLRLGEVFKSFYSLIKGVPIVFPIHPRTKAAIIKTWGEKDFVSWAKRLNLIEPLGYVDFLALMKNAKFVLTDSGGVQEETTVLGVPRLTLRHETERPITVEKGTNVIVGLNPEKIKENIKKIMRGKWKKAKKIENWDGRAAERIIKILRAECIN